MTLVKCSDCKNYITDKIGFGNGIGTCQPFENYKQELKKMNLPTHEYNKRITEAEVRLGIIPAHPAMKWPIKLLFPQIERICKRFDSK